MLLQIRMNRRMSDMARIALRIEFTSQAPRGYDQPTESPKNPNKPPKKELSTGSWSGLSPACVDILGGFNFCWLVYWVVCVVMGALRR